MFKWGEEEEIKRSWSAYHCLKSGRVVWEVRIEHDEDGNCWVWRVFAWDGSYTAEGSVPEEFDEEAELGDRGFEQCKIIAVAVLWQIGSWVPRVLAALYEELGESGEQHTKGANDRLSEDE